MLKLSHIAIATILLAIAPIAPAQSPTAAQARAIVEAVRYALPADHEKRLVVSMVETLEAIGNIDELLAVEGIDVFFIGPGDLSQNMGYPPAPPFGQPRPAKTLHARPVRLVETRLEADRDPQHVLQARELA